MTDKELLELAAKAAGIEVYESTDGTVQNRPILVFTAGGGMGTMPYEERWNPLRDDAQALRLAVKLNLSVFVWDEFVNVTQAITPFVELEIVEDEFTDKNAATRRAIVRAAAEIGKQKDAD